MGAFPVLRAPDSRRRLATSPQASSSSPSTSIPAAMRRHIPAERKSSFLPHTRSARSSSLLTTPRRRHRLPPSRSLGESPTAMGALLSPRRLVHRRRPAARWDHGIRVVKDAIYLMEDLARGLRPSMQLSRSRATSSYFSSVPQHPRQDGLFEEKAILQFAVLKFSLITMFIEPSSAKVYSSPIKLQKLPDKH